MAAVDGLVLDGVAITDIGRLDDVCPYCGGGLPRRPGRMAGCPHCGKSIHVRTRPYDGARVLVTGLEAIEIERQNEAFWEHLHFLETAAFEFPLLKPVCEDLRTGRRGRTPVDWSALAEIVRSTPTSSPPSYVAAVAERVRAGH